MNVQKFLVGMIAGCALFFFAMALPARAEVVPSKAPGSIQAKKTAEKPNQSKSAQQKKSAEKTAQPNKSDRKAQSASPTKKSGAASATAKKTELKAEAKAVAGQIVDPQARAEAPPGKKKSSRLASVSPAPTTPKTKKSSSKIDGKPVKVKAIRGADAHKLSGNEKVAKTQSEDASPSEAKTSAKAKRGDKAVKLSTKKLNKSKKVASAKSKKKKSSRTASRKTVCDPRLLRFLANASNEPGGAALSQAFRQLGTRYRSGASAPGSGFDCSGLTSFSFAAAGVDLPRSSRDQFRTGRKVSESELSPGDLVFFKRGSRIFHVGIYVTDGQFIHSSLSKGVTVDNLSDGYWRPKFAGGRKVID